MEKKTGQSVVTEETEDSSVRGKSGNKRLRHRSPNYPFLDLKAAIDCTAVLYRADGKHPMTVELAHHRWKYRAFSSGGEQTVAALRAYGLINVDGQGKKRKVRVSDSAERIIRKAPNHEELLREAALKPAIHHELWARYSQSGLPSNENIRTYLEWDREEGTFNKEVIDGVIKRFRDTLELAKLPNENIVENGHETKEVNENDDNDSPKPPPRLEQQDRRARLRGGEVILNQSREEVFVVPEGGEIILQYPAKLTTATFEDFKDWLNIAIRKIGRTVQDDLCDN